MIHIKVLVVPSSSFSSSSFSTYIHDNMLGTTTNLGASPLNRYCTPSSLAMASISLEQERFCMPAREREGGDCMLIHRIGFSCASMRAKFMREQKDWLVR